MKDCIFCKIIKREAPAEIIYENEHVLCFCGLNSSAPVHILVIPKKHIENIKDIKEEDGIIIAEIHKAFQVLAKKFGIEKSGFRVLTNTFEHGQQEVYHMHYHLLGGRQLKWGV